MDEIAQAAAPFELFVAVIIMTFVVIVGYQALTKVNNEVCLNTVDREMTVFKVNLEGAVNLKNQTKINFRPDSKCFSSKSAIMKIESEQDRRVCSARCGQPSDSCFIMTFSNPEVANGFKQKCLELPQYTSFVTLDNCSESSGTELATYTPIDPQRDGQIRIGSYVFKNISPAGDTYPKICVYYKP